MYLSTGRMYAFIFKENYMNKESVPGGRAQACDFRSSIPLRHGQAASEYGHKNL